MKFAEKIEVKPEKPKKDLKSILHSKSNNDYDKSLKYREYLRLNNLKRKKLKSLTSYSAPDGHILSEISSTYKPKAQRILNFMKTKGINWDSDNRVVHGAETFYDSDIIEYIKHLVIKKNSKVPKGFLKFLTLLKKKNLPFNLIGNKIHQSLGWESY